MTTMDAVTLSIAILGAVLGIISTWHSLDRSRLKLKVKPAHAVPYGTANLDINFCIEVTNLSDFAVTVKDVGFFYKGTKNRGAIIQPVLIDNGPWPRRLESRTSVTIYCQVGSKNIEKKIRAAYAITECGRTSTGKSPALRQLSRESF
ncbi:hypothetical protein ACQKFS_01125 [Pseudomonas guineae]|jgi:hypothetical protein|uniref:hypothetical protein n=1 Tax=Pseudomonas guineae TaxID=425504 RepID=UPI003D03BF6A